jgi:hypothetical protein
MFPWKLLKEAVLSPGHLVTLTLLHLFFPSVGTHRMLFIVPPSSTILPEVAGLIRATEAAVRPEALTNIWTDLHCAMLLMVTLLNFYKLSSLEHENLITYPAKIRSVFITISLTCLEILLSNARQVRPDLSKKK